jgi:hypothetical protein
MGPESTNVGLDGEAWPRPGFGIFCLIRGTDDHFTLPIPLLIPC